MNATVRQFTEIKIRKYKNTSCKFHFDKNPECGMYVGTSWYLRISWLWLWRIQSSGMGC